MVCRCVLSRNLVNEEVLANWGLLHQKIKFPEICSCTCSEYVQRKWGNSCMHLSSHCIRQRKRSPQLWCLLLNPAMRSNAGMANRQRDVDLRYAQFSARSLLCGWLVAWVFGQLVGWLLYPYLSSALEGDVWVSKHVSQSIRKDTI